MATIRFKRSTTPGATPAGLADGEPAVNLPDDRLYIGGAGADGYPLGAQYLPLVLLPDTPYDLGLDPVVDTTTVAQVAGNVHCKPIMFPRRVSIQTLELEVTTAAAGATIALAIYDNTVVDDVDQPGARLALTSSLDCSTTGVKTASLSFAFDAGRLYWAAWRADTAGPTVRALAGQYGAILGRTSITYTAVRSLQASGGTLSDPAPAVATLATGNVPMICFRIAT